ncbi:endonuclease/exonuclease/phosphatase family protein [Litorivita sp. NS0012-18]|uniref:endonuclease/exonuclease/phosphatase family protein n=1 Tax=Litorivita sp. NS0012-18 TaxID=3127655 RepID=UPI003102F011
MPFYNDLRPDADFSARDYARVFPQLTTPERLRAIDGLLRLKPALQAQLPQRRSEANLLVASWNLKEFGHTTQRLPEAYFYIAEIMAAFDLIAVQEIKSGLKDLDIVMRLLGPNWRYLINDITEGAAGNSERSGYIYNTRRLRPSGLAGEVGLWDEITSDSPLGLKQLKRAPYMTGFVAGWKRFAMVNLHLHPGKGADDVALRGEEMRLLLRALEEKRKGLWSDNLVLVGDMNLYGAHDDATVARIKAAGYRENGGLAGRDTNASLSEAYDRMFFRTGDYFRMAQTAAGGDSGAVFNPFDHVYREADVALYRDEMLADYTGARDLAGDDAALLSYYKHPWRKNQISDHFPIVAEVLIDDSAAFLAEKRAALAGTA